MPFTFFTTAINNLNMGKWLIIPDEIVMGIKQKCSFTKEFDIREFAENLREFKDTNLPKLTGGASLFESFKLDFPSDTKLLRALNGRKDPGVYDFQLLNLLCYYGFGKDWKQTLSQFNIEASMLKYRDNANELLDGEKLLNIAGKNKPYRINDLNEQSTIDAFTSFFNPKNIQINHSDYYIYYYISFNIIDKTYRFRYALLGLDFDETDEWFSGNIYYFSLETKISRIFKIDRIITGEMYPKFLYFTGKSGNQVNFYTVKVNNKPRDQRAILPLTYSVIETQSDLPSAGKAILERIDDKNFKQKLLDLYKKVEVKDSFINVLFMKKLMCEEYVGVTHSEFTNKQVEILKLIKGLWQGVYLRTDYGTGKKGGLVKFALYIKGSGECELHYAPVSNNKHCYTGFVVFPFDDKSIMKISLEYLHKEDTYRIYALLKADAIENTIPTYQGVITAWANVSHTIYSSTIYMEHVSDLDIKKLTQIDINEKINSIDPKRRSKVSNDTLSESEKRLISILRELETINSATFKNSWD
jgi:hypothetical protein